MNKKAIFSIFSLVMAGSTMIDAVTAVNIMSKEGVTADYKRTLEQLKAEHDRIIQKIEDDHKGAKTEDELEIVIREVERADDKYNRDKDRITAEYNKAMEISNSDKKLSIVVDVLEKKVLQAEECLQYALEHENSIDDFLAAVYLTGEQDSFMSFMAREDVEAAILNAINAKSHASEAITKAESAASEVRIAAILKKAEKVQKSANRALARVVEICESNNLYAKIIENAEITKREELETEIEAREFAEQAAAARANESEEMANKAEARANQASEEAIKAARLATGFQVELMKYRKMIASARE